MKMLKVKEKQKMVTTMTTHKVQKLNSNFETTETLVP
jgi:hypothetical protein